MKLAMDCNDLIRRVSACRPSIGGRISLNFVAPPQLSVPPPRTSMQSNPFRMESLIELEDLGSDQSAPPPYDHRRAEANWADFGATGTTVQPEASSRIATPTDFADRLHFTNAQSEFVTAEDMMVRSGATRNRLMLEDRPQQGSNCHIEQVQHQQTGTDRSTQQNAIPAPQVNSSVCEAS